MCIEELTNACSAYTRQIIEAIDREDEKEVKRVDALLSAAFDEVLTKEAMDREKKILQAEYLLSVLVPTSERTKNQSAICEKLLQIASQ